MADGHAALALCRRGEREVASNVHDCVAKRGRQFAERH